MQNHPLVNFNSYLLVNIHPPVALGRIRGYTEGLALLFPILNASTALLHTLGSPNSDKPLSDAIHCLIMSLLWEPRTVPFVTSSSVVILFIVFNNVTSCGMIKHANDIQGTLTKLKWPFQATCFREIQCLLSTQRDLNASHSNWEASVVQ